MRGLLQSRLNQIVLYKFLHNFATGMVSVFIPIYFAQNGLAIQQVFGIILVQAVAFALAAILVGKAVSRAGVNRSFLFSSMLYILLFATVQYLPVSPGLAVIAGVLNGLGMAFHWIPLNSEFTIGSESESRSRDYGKLEGIPSLIAPMAPLLGALILSELGFLSLLLASVAVVAVSALPLLAGDDTKRPEIDVGESLQLRDRYLWALYFLDGFASVPYTFIFPLFVYYIVGGTIETGAVKMLAGFGSGFLALASGYVTGRIGRKKMIYFGAAISAVLCVLIPVVETSIQAFALSFFLGVGYLAYSIPLISIISDIGEERELLGFFSVREIFQNLGRIVIMTVLVGTLYIMPREAAFTVTFYLNAASLIMLAFFAAWIGKRRDAIS